MGVVYFDLVEQGIEGLQQIHSVLFVPAIGCIRFSVTTSPFRTKVSVGSNPWAKGPLKYKPGDDLRALRRRRASRRRRLSAFEIGAGSSRARRAAQGNRRRAAHLTLALARNPY